MELVLDRRLSERRIFPAIDILKSGTLKEELLFTQEELSRTWLLRKYLGDKNPIECMEFMREKIVETKDNKEFFKYMNA
jgi:transcription termination factor Rho